MIIEYAEPETFVRIKKSIKPYGGRRLRLQHIEVYPKNKKYVVVAPNSPQKVGGWFTDLRTYEESEVITE